MTRYAYLENNQILEIHDSLPVSWRNHSNFNLMDSESLRELGWLPIIEPQVVPEYNSLWQRLDMYYVYAGNQVEAFYRIESYEPTSEEEIRRVYMTVVRDRRNSLLTGTDWTVLFDTIAVKGDAWRDAWVSYRQQLRDFPSQFETMPLEDLPDLDNIQWPTKP